MAQLKIPRFPNTTKELIYADFSGGLNYKDNASLIAVNQSPEMQNCRIRDKTITKRSGYSRLFSTSLGTGGINGIGIYKKVNITTYEIIAHQDKLYLLSDIDV